ncbi:cyanophycinase [Hymenobacter sp. H14-R3]|uniref:cyanophycinase n=1 Tax=Hymenobacter sp. H14-R3 TaxID=3046308 RepID=UPI0024BA4855|nr:cyanophycinase [Hymenobacter sp. H14-R3]MDJ0366191.1 cyanophycinase [Hymenobacter sp. H14-R3]
MTSALPLPAAAASPQATIVVLGGGHDDPTLALLAGLLPARTVPIEILTAATTHDPARTYAGYARVLAKLGCPNVGHLHIDEAYPADAPTTLGRLREASLVFLTGGDQERLTELLLGTEFLRMLHQRCQHEAGFVLAGTSAGASALGSQMLVAGRGWRSLLAGGIEVIPALGVLPNLLIDQHFAERARYPRLLHALLAHPALLGLGLSEETGVIFRPGQPPEVFGDEVVVLVDGRHVTASNYAARPAGQPISGKGFSMSLLVAGDTFSLASER